MQLCPQIISLLHYNQIMSILCHTDELAALLGCGQGELHHSAVLFIGMNDTVVVVCTGTTCTTRTSLVREATTCGVQRG
jgi:hypothetical protein